VKDGQYDEFVRLERRPGKALVEARLKAGGTDS
jgi:hypothetical protein